MAFETTTRLQGLYAITDASGDGIDGLAEQVEQSILGGARIIQYRDKSDDAKRRLRQAYELNALCRAYGVPLIINDDVELARAVGAAGVHLGQDDLPLPAARSRLGPDALIGTSCYNRLELGLAAASQGADYVAFGSFFPSPTKAGAVHAELNLLRRARRQLELPIVAIGGITPANGRVLVHAGADCLAVISGIFGQPDRRAAARAYAALFQPCP